MSTTTNWVKKTLSTLLIVDMDPLDQIYMAKSKTKIDYIQQLQNIVAVYSAQLTVKQLKKLIARYEKFKP